MKSSPQSFTLPTQRQIAEALGVSQATVATALNPRTSSRLSDETVQRVQSKAIELGYRPQRSAQTMRKQRSHTVGVLFQSPSFQPHNDRITLISQEFYRNGYHLIAADLEWFENDLETARSYFLDAAVEGLVFSNLQTPIPEGWLQPFQQRSVQIVSLGMAGTAHNLESLMDDFSADMESAYYHMTRHHLATGSRRLTLLLRPRLKGFSGPLPYSMMSRLRGFVRAMKDEGGVIQCGKDVQPFIGLDIQASPTKELAFRNTGAPEGIIHLPESMQKRVNIFEFGKMETTQLVRSLLPPDSILCTNDQMALGSIGACLNLGLSVPGQIRISGSDETPFSSSHVVPITTIKQPGIELAQAAARRLIEKLDSREDLTAQTPSPMPCEIIIRDSTCDAKTAFRLASEGVFSSPCEQVRFSVDITRP